MSQAAVVTSPAVVYLSSMSVGKRIEFIIRDRVEGVEVTPATIGLSRFNEFNRQVEEFVSGSQKLKLDGITPSIQQGSYKLVLALTVSVAAALEPDLKLLEREDVLGQIDPKRAEVLSKWQAQGKERPDLHYAILAEGMDVKPIHLSHASDFRIGEYDPWVRVEKYLFGTVVDMGGARKANVHIRLEDSGETVRVGTNQDYLLANSNDRLYRKILVRVEAEQHYRTGQWRNLRLLSFVDYAPRFDEAELDRFAQAGRTAWAGVPDAAEWVRELRGGAD